MTINLELPAALPLTADEYGRLPIPEGVRIELWNGSLDISAAAQMGWHSQTARRICNLFIDEHRLAYQEVGVVPGPRAVRTPDVTRFRPEVRPHSRGSQFPATDVDLVAEVVSPESRERDRVVEPLEYAAAGIPEFWLVEEDEADADDAIVNIFRLTIVPTGHAYTLTRKVNLTALEDAAADE
ncbi:MAG TPA: Uma2 family endonuclease [Rugosimonospora sp.]